ncbi:hypothetical protein [Blastococcus deserti]|uniref:Peptidase S9 n=1 Tax=Blastococcus deserti TaxID=2259033 RepID=A0ABW4X8Q0_9ACTN
MITKPSRSRAVAALATGAATVMYYATPDFIPSRRARGWTKAGLVAVSVAASVPELRAAWATARERPRLDGGLDGGLDGETPPSEAFGSLPARGKVVVLGFVGAVLAGSVGWVVVAERWAFRRGQARAAAGKRLPHTGPALLYGALEGGLWLLPTPSDTH